MTFSRAAVAAVAALAMGIPARVVAQSVRFDLPPSNPVPAAPVITIRAIDIAQPSGLRIRLRLALDFNIGLVVFDSSIAGVDARFTTRRLLPENRDIFAEATVIDLAGNVIVRSITPVGRTGPRLQLVSPAGRSGVSFQTRRPTFSWRSAAVTVPPGPWVYELFVTETISQITRSVLGIGDTVFTYPADLEANTSYRWKVVARLPNGIAEDTAVAVGASTFTISPSDVVVTTLLYQNFPNPFPSAGSPSTCIWFDLRATARVELSILDIRGHRVRTLVPGLLPAELAPGRYGRVDPSSETGCDPRLSWDGTADDGRIVPAGVYIVHFTADNVRATRKVVFRGR